MEVNNSKKKNFWENHTLNEFQILTIIKSVHPHSVDSVCFLKDGRIASSSSIDNNNVLIYNKITFQIEIRIHEKIGVYYMNINKDGILILCLRNIFVYLYEIKGKKYNIIQTIKPYNLFYNIIGKFDHNFPILKFIELKNGDIAFLVWSYAICFYKKKKNSKKYSYLNKFSEKKDEYTTDLCEINNLQYCIYVKYANEIRFLDMNSKKITKTIYLDVYHSDSYNKFLLMNEKDLFFLGINSISIIDVHQKEIIRTLSLPFIYDYFSSIYKLSNNIIIAGFESNYIQQIEYDEIKKELRLISEIKGKKRDTSAVIKVKSLSIFNNKLIVSAIRNNKGPSSLIVYKLKN